MIYEASFSGVLKIIFWFFVIAFIIRMVARMAMPYVVKKGEEHLRQRMQQMQQQQQPIRKEGEVTIEKKNASQSKNSDGDFVDYVEIKE